MNGWVIFLYVLFIVLAIAFIVLTLLFAQPVTTTNQKVQNNLQSNYNQGDGTINVNREVVPFQFFTSQQTRDVRNIATFSDTISGSALVSGQDKIVGNLFQIVGQFTTVISLQIIADFVGEDENGSTARTVAIYNADTRELLVQAEVSANDPLESGFYTHMLDSKDYVELKSLTNYAIMAVVSAVGDSTFVEANTVQAARNASLLGRVEVVGDTIELPTTSFTPLVNNLAFGAFQVQGHNEFPVVFSVSSLNGYATFPFNYVYNLNVSSPGVTTVFVDPGICIDFLNNTNMVSSTSLTLSTSIFGVPNGMDEGALEPHQWYAVFLMFSSTQFLPVAGLISKNRQQPQVSPIGYDAFRRVGWVRSDADARLVATVQTGNGVRRNTIYTGFLQVPSFNHIFTVLEIQFGTIFTLPLDLVSPIATSVTLKIDYSNPNDLPFRLNFRVVGSDTSFNFVLLEANRPGVGALAFITLPIPPLPLPHALEINVFNDGGPSPVDDIPVLIFVESFFDDL